MYTIGKYLYNKFKCSTFRFRLFSGLTTQNQKPRYFFLKNVPNNYQILKIEHVIYVIYLRS